MFHQLLLTIQNGLNLKNKWIRPLLSIASDQLKVSRNRAGGASSQGVLAKVALRVGHISMLDEWLVDGRRCLILDHLQDPHNVGACLRTALAFGFDVVVIGGDGYVTSRLLWQRWQ